MPRELLAFTFLSCTLCSYVAVLGLVWQEWRSRLGEVFPKSEQLMSQYIRDRSRVLFLAGIALFSFNALLMKVLLTFDLVGNPLIPRQSYVVISSLMPAIYQAFWFYQSWKLFIRHKYYLILSNSDWTKLLDCVDESQRLSFYARYKSVFTSEKGMASVISVCLLLWSVVIFVFRHDIDLLCNIVIAEVFLTMLATLVLLSRVPDSTTQVRTELLAIESCMVAVTVVFFVVFMLTEDEFMQRFESGLASALSLLIVTYISYVYIPSKVRREHENLHKLGNKTSFLTHPMDRKNEHDVSSSIRTELYDIMSEPNKLTEFQRFCCQTWCSENVICLLEIREFKALIRNGHSKRPSRLQLLRNSSRESMKRSLSAVKMLSLSASIEVTTQIALNQPTNHLKEWDLHCLVDLADLGCRSAIVHNPDLNLYEKAEQLFHKYFELSSDYCVNVSERSRKGITRKLGINGDSTNVNLKSKNHERIPVGYSIPDSSHTQTPRMNHLSTPNDLTPTAVSSTVDHTIPAYPSNLLSVLSAADAQCSKMSKSISITPPMGGDHTPRSADPIDNEVLLDLFEEAVIDIFDNLKDSLQRFHSQAARKTSVSKRSDH